MAWTWKLRMILRDKHASAVLRQRLKRETNVAVARDYGVAHATVARWRTRFEIPPFTQGAGTSSVVKEAVLRAMEPGQEYSFQQMREHVPGSRQQVYWILTRLTQAGHLVRRGKRNHYRWQRVHQHARARP